MAGGQALLERPEVRSEPGGRVLPGTDQRRFAIAAVVGMAVVSIPYLYVLWDLWTGSVSALRGVSPSSFYDLQAKALAHGHLYLPKSALGVEAFLHDGRAYTYFGLFPSLLRLPVLAILPGLQNRLTAPSMLLAWLVTGAFSALLLWRVRVLCRGSAALGWAEAASYGVLIATITGGSVLVYLAANPWVYDEDLAWSVALTMGCLFALLGVMERPSWRRVLFSGLLLTCADLNRLTTGWACIIGALLVAGWFAVGRGGRTNRRWALPVLGVGLFALAVGCAVNIWKFGGPFTLPLADQVWTQVNAHRRYFLSTNGGKGFSIRFLPSTLVAYFQPVGLRFSTLFPFITLPGSPARAVDGVVLDQLYAAGSVPDFMPLLFLLGIWGLVTAFRPRPVGDIRLTRVPLFAAAAATAGVMLWCYIADRYVADLLPILVLASVIGLVDLWRRASGRSRRLRAGLFAATAILAAFCVLANVGAALESMNSWNSTQALNFINAQRSFSLGSVAHTVERGNTLPYWAPTGQIFDVDSCSGLYLSSGVDFANSPGQQLDHSTWIPVEQRAGINSSLTFRINTAVSQLSGTTPLVRFGRTTVVLQPAGPKLAQIVVQHPGAGAPSWPSAGTEPLFRAHRTYLLTVTTDPYMHAVIVSLVTSVKAGKAITEKVGLGKGSAIITHYLAGTGRAVVVPSTPANGGSAPAVSVTAIPTPTSMSLCRSLSGNR